jgi:hypothetical protein
MSHGDSVRLSAQRAPLCFSPRWGMPSGMSNLKEAAALAASALGLAVVVVLALPVIAAVIAGIAIAAVIGIPIVVIRGVVHPSPSWESILTSSPDPSRESVSVGYSCRLDGDQVTERQDHHAAVFAAEYQCEPRSPKSTAAEKERARQKRLFEKMRKERES